MTTPTPKRISELEASDAIQETDITAVVRPGSGLNTRKATVAQVLQPVRDELGTMASQNADNVAITGGTGVFTSVTTALATVSSSAGQLATFNGTGANGGYMTWNTSGTTIADLGTSQQLFSTGGNDTFGINARGARSLLLGTNNTERMRITSAGNVGIGTASPRGLIDLNTTREPKVFFGTAGVIGETQNLAGDYIANNLRVSAETGDGTMTYTKTTDDDGNAVILDFSRGITFFTGATGATDATGTLNSFQRMRITSTGNVGIGTSAPNPAAGGGTYLAVSGGAARGNLELMTTAANTDNLLLGIVQFTSTTQDAGHFPPAQIWGSLSGGTSGQRGGKIELWTKANALTSGVVGLRVTNTGVVESGVDNTKTLGSGSFRWSEVFAGNGTINTSDAREKTEVRPLTASEIAASKDLAKEIGAFQFLASVAEKGEGARTHIGMTVQRAIEIMESHGLDPMAYGFICYNEWDEQVTEHPAVEAQDAVLDEEGNVTSPAVEAKAAWSEVTLEAGNRYGFRSEQMTMFIARGFEARLAALENAA